MLGKRSSSSYGWPVVALVLAIALGAVLWAQRQPVEGAKHPVADSAHATPTKPRENSPVPDAKPQTAKPELAKSQVAKSQTAKPQPAKPELAKSQTKSAEAKAAPSQKKRDEKPPIATTAQSIERSVPVPPKPKKPATQPATPAAKPGPHYTMMVASFLKKDMAFAEREHLSRLTNHPVWVSQRKINGVRTYRIILGAFESSDLAEDAAQKLLQRGLIRDARILALPLDP